MKISKFQIVVFGLMITFLIGGVIAFATFKGGGSSSNNLPAITIWGTFPKSIFDQYVISINNTLPQQLTVKYVQESEATFLNDFISALARGAGPDVVLIPAEMILPNEDKLTPVPYTILPQASFKSNYIDESFAYLTPNGAAAVPFSVDPLVMYWNRDLFNAAGIAVPPKDWDEFAAIDKKLTLKSVSGTITQSALAMGDFTNVNNAREILGTLFMQIGNPVTVQYSDGSVTSAIKISANNSPLPALDFFVKAVNPSLADYSWNRSWPNSKTAFLAGDLATYFGFASELKNIQAKNPNLNFDVTSMPQVRSGGIAATYGKIYGFSLVKASNNTNAAYQVISTLTDPQYLPTLEKAVYLPSISRNIIAAGSSDPYISIFDRAALIAKTWLDSDPAQSNQIFGDMVQAVVSGQKSDYQAITDAGNQYNVVLRQASAH